MSEEEKFIRDMENLKVGEVLSVNPKILIGENYESKKKSCGTCKNPLICPQYCGDCATYNYELWKE